MLLAGGTRTRVQRARQVAEVLAHVAEVPSVRDSFLHGDTGVVVFEDAGFVPLSARARRSGLHGVRDAVQVGLGVARALDAMHQAGVVHRSLAPWSVLLSEDGAEIRLLGLGRATRTVGEDPGELDPMADSELLPWLAPEQSGRMNRTVDARCDLYALGVLLYERLTGVLPLRADDAMSWVHAHIARRPSAVQTREPTVPSLLSQLVDRLLSKNPEERYQTASGLASDLQRMAAALATGEPLAFELGSQDRREAFRLPEQLLGRDAEVAVLMGALGGALQGTPALAAVVGAGGIGKSRLILELQRPLAEAQGFFVVGKADQYRRSLPYHALGQAVGELVRQVMARTERELRGWREALAEVLGPNARVLVDVAPEARYLLGDPPAVPAVSDVEAEARFNLVITAFLQVFARAEHPLVVFLDDVQWADGATLRALRQLLSSREVKHLLVLAAWRPGEVDQHHPLSGTLEAIESSGGTVVRVDLQPLQAPHVREYVAAVVGESPHVDALAALVGERTGSNPFFIGRTLQLLHGDGLLTWDADADGWTWSSEAVEQVNYSENVVELMLSRLRRLPPAVQRVLGVAAALGHRFSLGMAAECDGQPLGVVAAALSVAVQHRYVLAVGTGHQLVAAGEVDPGVEFRFVHDRVQEAAYGLIGTEAEPALHARIARVMDDAADAEDRLFEIAHHFEKALPVIVDPVARGLVALRFAAAAAKAQASSAHGTALRLFRGARDLLSADVWSDDHELAFRVHLGLLAALLASEQREEFEALAEDVLGHCDSVSERIRVQGLTSHLYVSQNRQPEYVDAVVALAARAGVTVRPVLGPEDFGAGFGEVMQALAGRTPDQLYDLPLVDDPERAAVFGLLTNAMPSAAMAAPQYYPSIIFEALKLGLEHGLDGPMVRVFSSFGMLLSTIGQFEQGYAFGQLAQRLRGRFPGSAESMRGFVEFPVFVQHWVEPLSATLPEMDFGEARALELGSMTEFGHLSNSHIQYLLHAGVPLADVLAQHEGYMPVWVRNDLQLALFASAPFAQVALEFAGQAPEPGRLNGPVFAFDALWEPIVAAGNGMMMMYALCALSQTSAFFGRSDRVVGLAPKRRELEGAAANPVSFATPVAVHYSSLCELQAASEAEGDARAALITGVEASLVKLDGWAAQVAANHAHRAAIVRAELARVTGDKLAALDGYDRAIRLARDNGFIQDVALGAEKAAAFHAAAGRGVVALSYAEMALSAYQDWGAEAKVAHMRALYPNLKGRRAAKPVHRALDIETLTRAAEAITREIVLERLLQRLMRIMIENAGANRGLLLIERDGLLEVRAEARADVESVDLEIRGLDDVDLPDGIVRYVARTNETVLLHDASREGRFVRDPYVERTEARSLLCLPLVQQGKRTGVLVLENTIAAHVFTAQRVELLRVLSSQAATAIENALLYRAAKAYSDELEHKNEQLREMDRLRDEFLAKTSHELRTPIHGIIGLTQALADDPSMPEAMTHDLDMIIGSGRRLSNLINDLLDFSTLRKKEIALNREPVSLRGLVVGVLGLMEPLVQSGQVTLVNAVPESLPAVFGDRDRLEQVLVNLVGNAVKFTAAGSITVSAEGVGDGRLALRVSDTGIGIPAEDLGRIFDVFEQGADDISATYGGTGLGLSVAQELVTLHEGTLSVTSELGSGSTFSVELPTTDQPATRRSSPRAGMARVVVGAAEVVDPSNDDGKGYDVLVVDDEPVNLQVLVNQLGRYGYNVVTARSGAEALARVEGGFRPDLVLLDVMMPNMNGYQVCTALRKTFDRGELPVVMVTAKDRVDDLVEGMSSGANDYVTKPFASAELLARVRTHLQLVKINGAVNRFVPKNFLQLLGRESIVDVRLGDSVEREMTIMFSDIRSFTSLSEQMTPEENFRFINEYLGVMEPLVLNTGGFVDKYLGDGILALFDTGPANAVKAGVGMLDALLAFNLERAERGKLPIQIGIGINTGTLMLGTVGGTNHMDTTVVSDAVNLTSRVESLNKRYGTSLLVTASTLAALDREAHSLRVLDVVAVDGKREPVEVYEVYDADPEAVRHAKDATLRMFEDAVRRFHARQVDEAFRLFMLCRTMNPMDLAVNQYIERCNRIRQSYMGAAY
ncbi:MAG: putative ATPase/signal transduction histidine kinase/class 3 adenylate cyclase [Myxococcota bacterium]